MLPRHEPHPSPRPSLPEWHHDPGGRPKGVEEVRTLAQNLTARVFEELERIALSSPDDRARLAAIQVILDRAWGKAPQAIEGDGAGGPLRIEIVQFGEPVVGRAAEAA